MIRILHFSDFHYKDSHPDDFVEMGLKIVQNVKENLGTNSLDLVVFSGDLVFSGNNVEVFRAASRDLFDPLKRDFGLSNDQILLTPGNHDRIFNGEMPMVKAVIDRCKTLDELESFCNNLDQLQFSIVGQKSYMDFMNEFYGESWEKTPLYWCRELTCHGHKIGLLSLNSSWRCCGDSKKDRGNLLYPVCMLRKALGKIRDTEFIFCTEHHGICDYQEYVTREFEDLLHDKCHFFFTGHYHKTSVNVNYDAEIGMIHISAPATFNRNDNEVRFGYNIIEFDEIELKAVICSYTYSSLQFLKAKEIYVDVPVSQEKIKQNNYRKLVRKRYTETLAKADELFVSHGPGMFISMFKEPIIKNKSVQDIIISRKEGEKTSLNAITYQTKSAIIFGYSKRGKTSLLRKIELDVLNEAIIHNVIPFYLNYLQYRGKDFDIMGLLKNYLEMNRRDTELRFKDTTLLLLIDDLNPTDSAFMKRLAEEMGKFESAHFIATAQESLSNQIPLLNFYGTDIDKYYIHDVTIREVHQLTKSWPTLTQDRKRDAEEKIIQIFEQMHIPLNYWSISLFLWIYAKTDNANVRNNFDLICLYIDELLDVQNYVKNPDFSVTFDDLKSYMGVLAVKLMKNGYAMSDADLVSFTEEYKKEHNKFTDNPLDIINYLLEKGILTRDPNKMVTIRLKGVFEYFVAYHMSKNSTFRDEILHLKNSFMPFGNEWELYAGFCKDDENSFRLLFDSVKEALQEWTIELGFNDVDSRLQQKVFIADNTREATGQLLKRLEQMPDEDEYDLLSIEGLQQVETIVQPKVFFDKIDITPTNIERMIYVLARIYRNSNICDMSGISNEMFEYILSGACNLGFMLINEAKSYVMDDDKTFLQLVSNCMPIIVEAFFYDAMAQKNLIRIFEEKLNTYMSQPEGNQMRIYMMAMVLMDIDAMRYKETVDRVLKVLTNKVLRFSVLQKIILNSIRDNGNLDVKNTLKPIRLMLSGEFYESYAVQNALEKHIRDVEIQRTVIRNSQKD